MEFGHIELFVKDTKASKDFFCDILGFELESDQGKNKWVRLENFLILLRHGTSKQERPTYQDSEAGIVLYTENVKQTSEHLKNKGLVFKGTDLSDDCLTFTDLDGHWFQLVNPNH